MAKFTGHTITNDSALGSAVVQRSLKFQAADNTRLVRTIGSTSNRRTFTYSFWIKRTMQSAEQYVLYNGHSSSTPYFDARFEANSHKFQFIDYTGSWPLQLITNRRFRDCTSWYHFVIAVDTTQGTASNRAKLYINGVQETSFSTETYPSQNHDTAANVSGNLQVWGTNKEGTSNDLDGYLAEANFVDGQQLTPSSFGFTDPVTGIWMPKRYEGTYGTNGFYLDFSDNSSTAALGIDKSPNGNDFTANNFSVSAGVGNDSSLDTPSNNFCTFNPLKTNPSARISYTEGNLQYNCVSGNNHLRSDPTMEVSSGKWYVEFKFISGYETANNTVSFGINTSGGHRDSNNDAVWYENSINYRALTYGNDGSVRKINASSSTTLISGLQTFANGDVMGIALDLDNNKMFVSKNGTFFSNGSGTQDPVTGAYPLHSGSDISSRKEQGWRFTISGYSNQVVTVDFGQQGYDYTPPTGFKAVCSKNMKPELSPAVLDPEKHFKCIKYTGTGSSNQIDTIGFRPDFVWCKRIENTSYHILTDALNGAANYFVSNTADGLSAGGTQIINQIRDNGFQVGTESNVNGNGETYTAWCWKGGSPKSPTSGSVYFENSTGQSIDIADHADFDLGTNDFTIEAFIFPTAQDQFNNIISVGTDSNNGYRMDLSTSNKLRLLAHIGGSWATVITGGTSIVRNFWYHVVITRSGNDFDCWVNGTKDATTVTNSGSITNPSADGVEIGRLSTNGYNRKYGGYISNLRFVNGTAVYTSNFSIPTSPLTNITNTKLLCCQDSYSATAAAVSPATPTLSNTGVRATAVNAFDAFCVDGTPHMSASAAGITEGSTSLGAATVNRKAGFSMIKYKGTGTTATVGHGLNRTPRIIFFRNQNGEGHDWNVYYNTPNGYGAGVRYLSLNDNDGGTYATNKYNSTTASSTLITVHTAADNNQSGQLITAWCWANIPGYQKIGIYRGNGNDDGEFVHTGFRPRWVWCKRVDSSGNWQVWDAARETENEMDQVFEFSDTNSSESSSNTAMDFCATGFKHRTSFTRSNATGDYLYMAIAETVHETPFDVMGNAR